MSPVASVVKHRYLKGPRAVAGAGEYTRYLEYRDGPDREEGGRKFFDRDQQDIVGGDVRQLWTAQKGRGPVMHELILSPGLNTVDRQEYVRELMENLERSKGQELEWYAVEHKNTDHHHIHVLIAGRDADGRQVRIDRNDHKALRELGDRYLEREHGLERYLERESDRVLKKEFQPDRGDDIYNRLFGYGQERDERPGPLREPDPFALPEPGDGGEQAGKEKTKKLEWDRDVAMDKLSDDKKFERDGQVFSKYSSQEDLERLNDKLTAGELERLPKEQYAQLRQWLKEKERYGDDYHERKDREKFDRQYNLSDEEREKRAKAREADRSFMDFEKKFSGDRKSGVIFRGKGRQQLQHEARGRLSDMHVAYQTGQERQRLADNMERDPANREIYEKQLESLNENFQREVEAWQRTFDVDDLLGLGRERNDRTDEKGKTPEKDRESQDHGEEQSQTDDRMRQLGTTEEQNSETEDTSKTDEKKKEDEDRQNKEERERQEREERERGER